MIVPVMAISKLVLTQQIYSWRDNGAHAHYREPVPLNDPKKHSHHVDIRNINNNNNNNNSDNNTTTNNNNKNNNNDDDDLTYFIDNNANY